MLREKQRALDARPIKKVAEAKARKKMRAVQRLEKAVKKAGEVNESGDMNEKEKAGAIQKLLAKGMSKGKKKKNDVKVVVAKGSHKGLKGRPKGVKGRYTMVDSRMKKEVCTLRYLASTKSDSRSWHRSGRRSGKRRPIRKENGYNHLDRFVHIFIGALRHFIYYALTWPRERLSRVTDPRSSGSSTMSAFRDSVVTAKPL
jgi:hypothetical protein